MERLEGKVDMAKGILKKPDLKSTVSTYEEGKRPSFSPEYRLVEGRFDPNPLTCRSCRCYPH